MGAPQIIVILIWGLGLGVELANHGKNRTGKHNFFNKLIGVSITAAILGMGGFFE
jgi:hypothetical protein